MTSDKQSEANKQNAKASTGPKTPEGKAIVARNAIKHGILTKNIIISDGDGKENERELKELTRNIVLCLNPQDQMQSLIVEQIIASCWRLKRIYNYEVGCIRSQLDTAISDYYNPEYSFDSKSHKTTDEINQKITDIQEAIDENMFFIFHLKEGRVNFENPFWEKEGSMIDVEKFITSFFSANNLKSSSDYTTLLPVEYLPFTKKMDVIHSNNFTDENICQFIIKEVADENLNYQRRIKSLESEKQKNQFAEDIAVKVCSMPPEDITKKIIKYESWIQKSIAGNLILLRNLQAS